MKKTSFFLSVSVVVVLIISSHLSATTRGISVVSKHGQSLYFYNDYQALVVGVSNYELWPKLPNAANDAVEVAKKLKSMGIHVKLVLDPTYREMKTALTDMVYEMGGEQNRGVLFFYAGHGETETLADGRKMGYIIPKDCPLLARNPRGFVNHAISMREIESASMRIRSKHVLMLFDSCFSGALFALVRAVPHDITEKSTLPVRQYITAGREDEEVPDQSMFKRCLLIGLGGDADLTGDGYITGSELGMYLSDKVVNYTHRQQHPQYGKINNPDLDRGDFVFALNESNRKKGIEQVKQAKWTAKPEKSQLDMDDLLAKIREKEEAKKRAKEALIQQVKELRDDLSKYKKIVNAKLDETIELAAWEVLRQKYPEWTHKVNPGDTTTLIKHALANDDGSLRKILTPTVDIAKKEHVVAIVEETISPPEKKVARDERFIAYANGTVLDTKTNLMWAGASSGSSLSEYSDAEDYCERYSGGGYKDWRMPTIDELNSLYNENLSNDQGYHVTKLISVGGNYVWGMQNSWGGTGVFNFKTRTSELGYHEVYGNRIFGDGLINLDPMALPVRTKN
jgi:hypothetical protein